MNKHNKQPNKFLAPIAIAGVTIGFLASAYKFVFAKAEPNKTRQQEPVQQEPLKQEAIEPENSEQKPS